MARLEGDGVLSIQLYCKCMDDSRNWQGAVDFPCRSWSVPEAIVLTDEQVEKLKQDHDNHPRLKGFGNE